MTAWEWAAIQARVSLAQQVWGVSFDGSPDQERSPVDILRDRDRAALVREVERLQALVPEANR